MNNSKMEKEILLKEIEELKQNLEYEKEKTRIAETNNRLNVEKIKKLKQELKIVTKERDSLKQDIASVEKHIDLKRCESCNELVPETIMCYVGNENICEECNVNGFGR